MFDFIKVSFSICFFVLTGWTIITYFVKEDSQQFIKEELKNLFDISKKFFISLKSLIGILAKNSFTYNPNQTNTIETNELNEHPLSLVKPIKETESHSLEVPIQENDDDTALSSFSPEVVEVIEEEEEKIA